MTLNAYIPPTQSKWPAKMQYRSNLDPKPPCEQSETWEPGNQERPMLEIAQAGS